MSTVYVILEREGKGQFRPVGVVTSETTANAFYVKDSENRDWISFTLDELPENMQPLPEPATTPAAPGLPSDAELEQHQRSVEDTRQRVEKMNQQVQQMVQKLQPKKR